MSHRKPDANEPQFEDPFRPTAEERAAWEEWRDAEQEKRDQAQRAREAAQGAPRPEPTLVNASELVEDSNARSARSAFDENDTADETVHVSDGEGAVTDDAE